MLTKAQPDVSDIFEGSGWTYIPTEALKRQRIYPNQVVYHDERQIIALILKKSPQYGDYGLNKAGLQYIAEVEASGKLRNGKPMSSAVIVLARADAKAQVAGALKIVTTLAVTQAQAQVRNVVPSAGKNGTEYWFISFDGGPDDEDDDVF